MNIGLIARADRSGLATQTWEFWRHVKPAKTVVINPTWVGSGQSLDLSMYPGATVMDAKPYPQTAMFRTPEVDEFLDELDVVFTCETPYNWWIFERARARGVKTVLQYNYEFFPPAEMPLPDLFAAPSLWHWDDVPYTNKVFLPVPVNRADLPFTLRTELHEILHTAGMPAHLDRNGTRLVMAAMSHLPSDVDVKLTVRCQRLIPNPCPSRIVLDCQVHDRHYDLYRGEDVYVMPRKFGGLSLPVNEAASLGMPVIMTDLEPQNGFLPPEALLPCWRGESFMACRPITAYETDPVTVARKIEELHKTPELVRELSGYSDKYAAAISWERMLPIYLSVFESLLP